MSCVHHWHSDPCARTHVTCCNCGARETHPDAVRPWPPADASACGPFVPGRHPADVPRKSWHAETVAREAAAAVRRSAAEQRVLERAGTRRGAA